VRLFGSVFATSLKLKERNVTEKRESRSFSHLAISRESRFDVDLRFRRASVGAQGCAPAAAFARLFFSLFFLSLPSFLSPLAASRGPRVGISGGIFQKIGNEFAAR
jgi:hypothetical protein